MTRQQFIERHRHEIGGLVLDAATWGAHGSELSVRLRHVMRAIDAKLAEVYDDLVPPLEPAAPAKEKP